MVTVVQTLVRKQYVMLLDETANAFDLHHQLSIMQPVKTETELRKRIVLASLHDLNLAAKFCDRPGFCTMATF